MIPVFGRFLAAIWRRARDPEFRILLLTVASTLAAGTRVYARFEGWSVLDSLSSSVITLTTVGYGDLSPNRPVTKSFTIVFVLVGIILLGLINIVAKHASAEGWIGRRVAPPRTDDGSSGGPDQA